MARLNYPFFDFLCLSNRGVLHCLFLTFSHTGKKMSAQNIPASVAGSWNFPVSFGTPVFQQNTYFYPTLSQVCQSDFLKGKENVMYKKDQGAPQGLYL